MGKRLTRRDGPINRNLTDSDLPSYTISPNSDTNLWSDGLGNGENNTLTPFICNHDGSCDNVRICCTETEMTLTQEDAERIDALGYARDDYMIQAGFGFCQLKNIGGHCYFYDTKTKECRIYENRPDGCRYYPIIYHYDKRKCNVDKDCPSHATVTRDDIRKVCHKVRRLVEQLRSEASHDESPC